MPDRDDVLLQQVFALPALRPHQRRALAALREKRDVLVLLATGGGKSLCYQFPAVAGMAPAIVVSPLVALMKDQVDALVRRGIAAAQVSATVPERERAAIWRAFEARQITLLYLAPEALDNPHTRQAIARTAPALLAIDEAHCISEWGESFRPSYLRLGELRRAIGAPPTIALTATATARTQREIVSRLGLREVELIAAGYDRPNLFFEVERVADAWARSRRLAELARTGEGSAVFYASTRRQTEAIAAQLRRTGVMARGYHAGLPPRERNAVQDAFLAGSLDTIVATCAFGMGVDKPDVRLVVHAAPPPSLEAYYQEAGRAGRDGARGRCLALLAPDDIARARARIDRPVPGVALMHRLYALVRDAHRHKRPPPNDPHALAPALGVSASHAARALQMLVRGGVLGAVLPASAGVHIVATPGRLAGDASLDPSDVAFVRKVAALVGSSTAPSAVSVTRRQLRALENELSLDERLRRVEGAQLLIWRHAAHTLRCAAPWDESSIRELQHAEERRVRRDVWRFEAVARYFGSMRCRRWVLLRYFGDESPPLGCGHCDTCCASVPAGPDACPDRTPSTSARRAPVARSP